MARKNERLWIGKGISYCWTHPKQRITDWYVAWASRNSSFGGIVARVVRGQQLYVPPPPTKRCWIRSIRKRALGKTSSGESAASRNRKLSKAARKFIPRLRIYQDRVEANQWWSRSIAGRTQLEEGFNGTKLRLEGKTGTAPTPTPTRLR